jgi:hypothetical protein
VAFTSTLQREQLALIGKKDFGNGVVVDIQRMKMLKRLWPKITSTAPVSVRFVSQQSIQDAAAWGVPDLFYPNGNSFADPGPVSGRTVGFEVSATDVVWRIDGYKIDVVPMGEY